MRKKKAVLDFSRNFEELLKKQAAFREKQTKAAFTRSLQGFLFLFLFFTAGFLYFLWLAESFFSQLLLCFLCVIVFVLLVRLFVSKKRVLFGSELMNKTWVKDGKRLRFAIAPVEDDFVPKTMGLGLLGVGWGVALVFTICFSFQLIRLLLFYLPQRGFLILSDSIWTLFSLGVLVVISSVFRVNLKHLRRGFKLKPGYPIVFEAGEYPITIGDTTDFWVRLQQASINTSIGVSFYLRETTSICGDRRNTNFHERILVKHQAFHGGKMAVSQDNRHEYMFQVFFSPQDYVPSQRHAFPFAGRDDYMWFARIQVFEQQMLVSQQDFPLVCLPTSDQICPCPSTVRSAKNDGEEAETGENTEKNTEKPDANSK